MPAPETGLTFSNRIALERFTTNQIYLNGSGVASGDFDGDGRPDVFFAGLGGGSVLYRNRGNWRFEDVTEAARIAAVTRSLDASGAAFVDLDGDGDLDLLVNSVGGGTHWLKNEGAGRFTGGGVVNPRRGGTSLAVSDLDGDGDLDVYVTNYRTDTLRDKPRTNFRIEKVNGTNVVALVNGQPVSSPELEGRYTFAASGGITEHGEADAVFRNDGNGVLTPIGFTSGMFLDGTGRPLEKPPYEWGLSVMARDFTGDGWPDLYVCNDFGSEDRFWINRGRGRFQAASVWSLRSTSQFSMGVDAADLDRDGRDDLFVLDMLSRSHAVRLTRMDGSMPAPEPGAMGTRPQYARSTLHRARGDGTFEEIAQYAGLDATEWSWTPVFLDVDLDGFEDLLVTTGHGRDDTHLDYGNRIETLRRTQRMGVLEELSLRKDTPALATPNLAFRNVRGTLRFEEVGRDWGFGDESGVSHGMCLADLDGDGDLDVLVNRMNAGAAVYRNDSAAGRLAVRLRGAKGNTRGIGARIEVEGGAVPLQSQEMICGGRYLSSDDFMRVFATGSAKDGMRVTVRWPGGRRSVLENVAANQVLEIDEASAGSAVAGPDPASGSGAPWFTDESARLGHAHYEAPFDDFERQPLLPWRQSQSGPGVAWLDVNGDDVDDLIVGSGRGGRTSLFLGNGKDKFQRVDSNPVPRDQTGLAGWNQVGAPAVVLVGSTGWEDRDASGGGVERVDAAGKAVSELPGGSGSAGPLALGDFDGDGDLDLFVGGRAVPGRYPEAAASRLWERRDGGWIARPDADRALAGVGLVNGALWTDLDNDGLPELVLACEWGPVRVFAHTGGQWAEVTKRWGLDAQTGWWTGVHAGDFDGDGRMDLVVGNWGLNTKYRATPEHPRRLYYGDLAQVGQVEVVEAGWDEGGRRWVPERDLTAMSRSLPWLRARFATHRAYAEAGIEDVLGDRLAAARVLEATTLATTLFLNRTQRFESVVLPAPAQWSPVFGIAVADFDLDGREDLFLAQNFFALPAVTSRSDAGQGTVLRGMGQGRFARVAPGTTGIAVYGEQRGCAVADFDGDGRPDLVVTQNAGPTRLFRNASPARGVRVRLKGPAGNPQGIGSVLRVEHGDGSVGPTRELHAGSGYGSQDSAITVVAAPKGPAVLHVRWPGGRQTSHPIPDGATSVEAAPGGPAQ